MPLLPRHVVGKVIENLREYGLRQTMELSGLWITQHLLGSTIHRYSRASLASFAESSASLHFSAEDLAGTYLFPDERENQLSRLHSEYESLCTEITRRYNTRRQLYPRNYSLEKGSAFLLYALVRFLRPSTVLETGVANGHSSFFILSALRANGHGMLHSIDRSPAVGSLLAGEERERWRLHLLQKGLKSSFMQIVDALQPIDLFLHDSDHSYYWQAFELQATLKRLAAGGVLACDDCDGCNAFLDFCHSASFRPVILVESRKVFGLVFPEHQTEAVSTMRVGSLASRQRPLVRV
jgi:predicted O-methyltransferase YrrM